MEIYLKKPIKIAVLFLFSVAVHNFSSAQKRADSLVNRLSLIHSNVQSADNDTICANILILISEEFVKDNDHSRAEEYANKAIKISDSLIINTKYDLLLKTVKARALLVLARVNSERNNYDQAIEFCRQSILVCGDLENKYPSNNNIERIIGSALNATGSNYFFLGTLDKALEAYLGALKIFEQMGDSKKIISVNNNIGLIHQQKADSKKALEYYMKGLSTSEKEDDKRNIALSLNNIGSVYLSDGDYFSGNGNLQNAEECYNRALPFFVKAMRINKETGNNIWLAFNYSNIGQIFEKKNKFDSALYYYQRALIIRENSDEKRGIVFSHQNIGSVFLKQGKTALAKEQFLISLNMAIVLKTKEQIMDAYFSLSECENKTGNFRNAYQYHLSYSAIKDSILNEKSSRQITEMQTKFETEKKDKENVELRQKNALQLLLTKHEEEKRKTQLAFSIIIIITIIVCTAVVYNRYKLKQKVFLVTELSRQEKLRFVAILDAEEKERVRIAKELHDSLGQMLSVARLNVSSLSGSIQLADEMVLNNSIKIIDNACEEVRTISHNMMPVALIRLGLTAAVEEIIAEINYSGKVAADFTTDIEQRFSESKEITVYRIIQEILNNILKHAEASEIGISLKKQDANIELTIADNGKGFDVAGISSAKGLGWRNIYSRTAMLNGEINVNSSPGRTTVDIVFPA